MDAATEVQINDPFDGTVLDTQQPPPDAIAERKAFANGLRAIADWYESHPEIPLPCGTSITNAGLDTKEEAVTVVRALGKCTKQYNGDILSIRRGFGPISLDFLFYRDQVCTKRVTGTRTIPAHQVDERVEEIVEWDCEPILAPDSLRAQSLLGTPVAEKTCVQG